MKRAGCVTAASWLQQPCCGPSWQRQLIQIVWIGRINEFRISEMQAANRDRSQICDQNKARPVGKVPACDQASAFLDLKIAFDGACRREARNDIFLSQREKLAIKG